MYMALAPSTLLFFYAILAGAVLGVCYDVFRILRVARPPGKIGIIVEDLFFALICIIVTLVFLQIFTGGAFRFFIPVGEAVGFLLYHLTIGALVIRVARQVIRFLQTLISFLFLPFRIVFRWFFQKLRPLFRRFAEKLKIFLKMIKKHLPSLPNLLYNRNHHQKKTQPHFSHLSKRTRQRNRGKRNENNKNQKKDKSAAV